MNRVLELVTQAMKQQKSETLMKQDLRDLCERVDEAVCSSPKFVEFVAELMDPCGPNAKDSEKANEHRLVGNENFKSSMFDKAIESYTKALQYLPGDCSKHSADAARIYANRAACLMKAGEIEAAVLDCTRAISHDEKYSKAWFRRGSALATDGRWEAAKSDLETALQLEALALSAPGVKQVTLELAKVKAAIGETSSCSTVIAEQCDSNQTEADRMGDTRKGPVSVNSPLSGGTPEQSAREDEGQLGDGQEGVTMLWTAERGRGLGATKGLYAGELFLSEAPYAAVLRKNLRRCRCHFCFQCLPPNPIPCRGCYLPLYCNEACRKSAWVGNRRPLSDGSKRFKEVDKCEKGEIDECIQDKASKAGIVEDYRRRVDSKQDVASVDRDFSGQVEILEMRTGKTWGEHRHECGGTSWAFVLPEKAAVAARMFVRQTCEESFEKIEEAEERQEETGSRDIPSGNTRRAFGVDCERRTSENSDRLAQSLKREEARLESCGREIGDGSFWQKQSLWKKVQSLQDHMELIPDAEMLDLMALSLVVSYCVRHSLCRIVESLEPKAVAVEYVGREFAARRDAADYDCYAMKEMYRRACSKTTAWKLFRTFGVLRVNSMAVKGFPFGKGLEGSTFFTGAEGQQRRKTYSSAVESFNEEELGTAVYPTASLLNHSCDPNAFITFNGRILNARAVQTVAGGVPLEISYGPQKGEATVAERRKQLAEQWGFVCSCSACTNNDVLDLTLWGYRCQTPGCFGVVPGPNTLEDDLEYSVCRTEGGLQQHDVTRYTKKKAKVGTCCTCGTDADIHRLQTLEQAEIHQLTRIIRSFSDNTKGQEIGQAELPLQPNLKAGNATSRLLRSSLTSLEAVLHPYNRVLAQWNDRIAEAFCHFGLHALAEPYLRASIDILQHHHPSDSVVLAHERAKLASVLHAVSKSVEAQRERALAEEVFVRYYGPPCG